MLVTLAKALKVKNQAAGRLAQLQLFVIQRNRVLEVNKDVYNVREKFEEANKVRDGLVRLKQAIARANGPIQADIVELAETKALLTHYSSINTDVSVSMRENYNSGEVYEERYVVTITEQEKESLVRKCEKRIIELQDKLDEFNATTKVDIDEALLA